MFFRFLGHFFRAGFRWKVNEFYFFLCGQRKVETSPHFTLNRLNLIRVDLDFFFVAVISFRRHRLLHSWNPLLSTWWVWSQYCPKTKQYREKILLSFVRNLPRNHNSVFSLWGKSGKRINKLKQGWIKWLSIRPKNPKDQFSNPAANLAYLLASYFPLTIILFLWR